MADHSIMLPIMLCDDSTASLSIIVLSSRSMRATTAGSGGKWMAQKIMDRSSRLLSMSFSVVFF
jgi:hypothetical protein